MRNQENYVYISFIKYYLIIFFKIFNRCLKKKDNLEKNLRSRFSDNGSII